MQTFVKNEGIDNTVRCKMKANGEVEQWSQTLPQLTASHAELLHSPTTTCKHRLRRSHCVDLKHGSDRLNDAGAGNSVRVAVVVTSS